MRPLRSREETAKKLAPPDIVAHIIASFSGEMAEWFKAHAWKACVGNTTGGSNPSLSASLIFLENRADAEEVSLGRN